MKSVTRNRKAKTDWALIGIVLVVVLVVSGVLDLSGLIPTQITPTETVPVNKQIKFHIVDAYGGGPLASKTDKLQLYASDGETILEDLMDTDGSGSCTTGSDFASGTVLYLRYEDSNDKIWWKFTVPEMNEKDAESATYNLIRLESVAIGTYTDAFSYANGTSIADAATHDISDDGSNPHLIYTITNTGSDNTGVKSSYDPIYDMNWNVEMYIVISGTGYQRLLVYDLDWDFTLGTTHYVGTTIDPYALTKHKVGTEYRSLGRKEVSYWIDTSGAETGDSVTFQTYVYAYSDHNYCMNHGGAYGPEKVELAENTLTVQP